MKTKTVLILSLLLSLLSTIIFCWHFLCTPIYFIGEANAISTVELNKVIYFYQKHGRCPFGKVKRLPSVKFIKSMWYDKAENEHTCLIVSDSQEITTRQKGKFFIVSATFDTDRKLIHKNCSTNISKLLPYFYGHCTDPIIYKKYIK